jgi:ribose 1,5-bisphosphate isomerase
MQFDRVVEDIKSLRLQGAESIAKGAVRALQQIAKRSKAHSAGELMAELLYAQKVLIGARPTEPCMRNALNYVLKNVNRKDLAKLASDVFDHCSFVMRYFEEAERKIAAYGAQKIAKHAVIFTHCHSTAVMMILAKAKFDGKAFSVHNTETRPLFQGRITARECAALGIPVSHYVDSAARLALKKADLFLFGADAIQSDGKIINKIGTEMFLEIARRYDIPSYCCTVSWKFDALTVYGVPEPIENRKPEEVWKARPKGVAVMNPAFEVVEPDLVSGVITELGVFRPEVFVDEVRRSSPWLF